jgi:hypothetical protein
MDGSSQPPRSPDAVFDLLSFLVSSARGALEEGVYTASLRLLDAAGRLAALATEQGADDFVARLGEQIRAEGTASYLESAETYIAFLDRVLSEVAGEIRRRNGLEPSPGPTS